jgi:protein-tyrosine phosphatase
MGDVLGLDRAPFGRIENQVRPRFTKAVAVSAGLSLLFLVVYGGCNWITAQRSGVATLNFHWEHFIPFVPLMIIPYMSIDLFFVSAPFLCRDNRQLSVFAKRVAAAIVISGICFLFVPFRFAFERPHTAGWLGALFDWFRGMDGPYNQFPSLHITLCLLLADTYVRRTRCVIRAALIVWFGLIGLSPLLTYQHHLLDLVGGFALAGYCFYFIRESKTRLPITKNLRVGFYYALGALIVLGLVVAFWPWGAILLWPTISLAIVAAGYFGAGPSIYHKSDGRLPISTWWVLGPCLLGQQASLLYYRRQCRPWDQVTPAVWIGGVLGDQQAAVAISAGVTAVLDLTAEFSEAKAFRALHYRNIAILDLTAPTTQRLKQMAGFIEEESNKGIVYVHCKIGYSRSAAAVAAYLIATGKADSVDEALGHVRRVRPSIVVRTEVIAVLHEFSARFQSRVTV